MQVELTDSMLNSEENILSSLNEVGLIATEEALKHSARWKAPIIKLKRFKKECTGIEIWNF